MIEHPTERLSAWIDGEMEISEREALERHVASCADCRALVADLQWVVAGAKGLEDRPPARDLWPGIEARLTPQAEISADDERVVPIERWRRPFGTGRRFSFSIPELVAAAIALIVLSGGATWWTWSGGPTSGPVVERAEAPATGTAAQGTLVADDAERSYTSAVEELERAFEATKGRLDPQTVSTVEENLRIIDAAIEETLRALEADPNSIYLYDHLAATRQQKIDVLRQATEIVRTSI